MRFRVGPATQCRPRFADADEVKDELQRASLELHPRNDALGVLVRGRLFHLPLWEGPAVEYVCPSQVDAFTYLADGRMVVVALGSEVNKLPTVSVHPGSNPEKQKPKGAPTPLRLRWGKKTATWAPPGGHLVDIGIVQSILASPDDRRLAVVNHRLQIMVVELDGGAATLRVVDTSDCDLGVEDMAWSPDGRWLAFTKHTSMVTSVIRICDTDSAKMACMSVTSGRYVDHGPEFDPSGRYLFYISGRNFRAIPDDLAVNYGFPEVERPFVLTLRADMRSPLQRDPQPPSYDSADEDEDESSSDHSDADGDAGTGAQTRGAAKHGDQGEDEDLPIEIDFDGIVGRTEALPVRVGRYKALASLTKDRITYVRQSSLHSLRASSGDGDGDGGGSDDDEEETGGDGQLIRFSFRNRREILLQDKVRGVCHSPDRQVMAFVDHDADIKVYKSGEPPHDADDDGSDDDETEAPAGRVDVDKRIALQIDPATEWRWMFIDACRLYRELFCDPGMGGMDWAHYAQTYASLLPRVATRAEWSDLVCDLLKELEVSHISETGGDDTDFGSGTELQEPGHLGLSTSWDAAVNGYRIDSIVHGESWDPATRGPMAAVVGHPVAVRDVVVGVNHRKFSPGWTLRAAMDNMAGKDVFVTLMRPPSPPGGDSGGGGSGTPDARPTTSKKKRKKKTVADGAAASGAGAGKGQVYTVRVRPCDFITLEAARHLDWVAAQREWVDAQSNGAIGYVHVPDMEKEGYSRFQREFLVESQKRALIVDVRWNEGGHTSEVMLPWLMPKPTLRVQPRWGKALKYPAHACTPTLALLINEDTASDGEILVRFA